MKPILEELQIIYVYAVHHETQTNFLSGRDTQIEVPTKEIHLFEIIKTDELTEPAAESLCGIDRSKIGKNIKEKDKRPSGLPVCKKCEQVWKEDKRSPWHKWQEGKAL